jgi:hypothetical protein
MVMIRFVRTLLLAFFIFAGGDSFAQASAAGAKTVKAKPRKLFMPQAYLGSTDYKGGNIKKEELSKLLKLGVTSRDSAGNTYRVTGFEFAYAERMLYEDSLSNLMVEVDYMTEYCPGDTLSAGVSGSIYDRLKAGDTVYFNKIDVYRTYPGHPGGEQIVGRGMKFVIVK